MTRPSIRPAASAAASDAAAGDDRPDPAHAARLAGLRYTSDTQPGIRRVRRGRGVSYVDPDGKPVRDAETLERIRALAIPPAWTDVWICRWPNGHLQASGRDARGRKQSRYHARWRSARDESKFDRMLAFAGALPVIREQTDEDLARPGLPREKVLAAVVRLLELTLVRVGNEEYARLNRSFGLTTLRNRHATVTGRKVHFRFRGKGGKLHEVGIANQRLARLVRRCQDLPGQELFQYIDEDGERRDIESADVNDYIREISGGDFTAKDFRTWAGTVLAYRALKALEPADSVTDARRNVVAAIRVTASRLGNTPAVARKSYVHPAVLDAYLDGRLGGALVEAAEEQEEPPAEASPEEEAEVAELLGQRLEIAAAGVETVPQRRRAKRKSGTG